MTMLSFWRHASPSALFLFVVLSVGCSSNAGDPSGSVAAEDAITANHPKLMPLNVPGTFAATPYGYFDPSCMVHVEPGDTALSDGSIRKAHGEIDQVANCTAPRFDPAGNAMPIGTAGATSAPHPASSTAYNGWIESYSTTSTGALSYLAGTWIVPAPPAAPNDGQTVYFFNGLEGLPTVESILQPVLAFSSGHWTATSWNCCKSGTTYYGNTIDVNPGDVIVGTVTGTGCDTSTGICNDWSIETLDRTSGQAATLQTSAWGVAENWVFAAVLEVYGVTTCSDLPASGELAFFNQTYATVSGASATASWSLGLGQVAPSCGYGGAINGSSVTLDFTGAGSADATVGNGIAVGGSYSLQTLANLGSCLDVDADGSALFTQVDEYSCNGTPAQMFTVVDAGNGLVNLVHPHSGLCVDVYASGTADGTNVDLYTCNGTGAQSFAVQTDTSGNVTFMNSNSGKCLDVTGSNPANFTRLEIWDCTGGANQKWQPAPGGLANGAAYSFETLANTASCLDIYYDESVDGTQVEEFTCNGTAAQAFVIEDAGDGLISLKNPGDGKCIDLYSAGTADGTKVEVWDCNGTPAQQFYVKSDANLDLTFVNPHSGRCLDIAGASTASFTPVELWDCNGGANQKWLPVAQ